MSQLAMRELPHNIEQAATILLQLPLEPSKRPHPAAARNMILTHTHTRAALVYSLPIGEHFQNELHHIIQVLEDRHSMPASYRHYVRDPVPIFACAVLDTWPGPRYDPRWP